MPNIFILVGCNMNCLMSYLINCLIVASYCGDAVVIVVAEFDRSLGHDAQSRILVVGRNGREV